MAIKKEILYPSIFVAIGLIGLFSWTTLAVPELKNANEYFELRLETFERWEILESLDSDQYVTEFARGELKFEVLEDNGSELTIYDHEFTSNWQTGEVIWETDDTATVDRHSRKSVDWDSYFLFPLDTQKQDYTFGIFGDKPHTFSFVKSFELFDMEVYEFETVDTYDISGAYEKFPDEKILADQTTTYVVEPITGQIVSYTTFWQDYIETDNGRIIVSNGNADTSQYSKDILLNRALEIIKVYEIYDTVIPSGIIAATAVFAILVFILERLFYKQKQLLVKEKEKFEVVGRLASNVAHDLRNPLSVVKNSTFIIKHRVGDSRPDVTRQVDYIQEGINRMSHQIDDVLGFVKKREPSYAVIDSKELFDQVLFSLKKPDNVDIHLPKNSIIFEGDNIMIQSAVGNVILNAIQAVGKTKGDVSVKCYEKELDIVIEVSDSGPGIPLDKKEKIFEPLYTSKQEGTGLGLASVRNIIEAHGGSITIKECKPATFEIILPKSLDNNSQKIVKSTIEE